MGREIRRVPPNWEHPEKSYERYNRQTGRYEKTMDYQPMYDRWFEDEVEEWDEDNKDWESGLRPNYDPDNGGRVWVPAAEWEYKSIYANRPDMTWADYHHERPSDPAYYRPYRDEEATWYQMYETVTEGTPVTPPFATKEELVEYLVANGDFWDQERRAEGVMDMPCGPWERKHAESFVFGSGWAPSAVIIRSPEGVEIKTARDGI